MAQTLMARLLPLFRPHFWGPRKNPIAANLEYPVMNFFFIIKMVYCVYTIESSRWGDSNENTNIPSFLKKIENIFVLSLALWLTFICSNYPCLELIIMVPKVFEPLKFYSSQLRSFYHLFNQWLIFVETSLKSLQQYRPVFVCTVELQWLRTLMARLPRLFRTRSWVPWKKIL